MSIHNILLFKTESGKEPFNDWFSKLENNTKKRIIAGLNKAQAGNMGDHEHLGEGVSELKFHFDGGYRIYFGNDGKSLVILLCAGNKKTQKRDIEKAKNYWREYNDNKEK